MGSSSSKFRKHLYNGDEYAALHLFNSNSDLNRHLDPNCSYGDVYNHDTPMHLASRHALKSLLRIFLHEKGGNPNKRNKNEETALHCVTQLAPESLNQIQVQRRYECVELLLQWRGSVVVADGEPEKVDLSAADKDGNTALHNTAAAGLSQLVQLLVNSGASMFAENSQRQTPCDTAEQNYHCQVALYLESKMVFSNEEDLNSAESCKQPTEEESYVGLRAQDLQEAKDQLLVETSDMLRVPLFTAEVLLRNHEWSRQVLLDAWMADAFLCCEKAGVLPPRSLMDGPGNTAPLAQHELTSPTLLTPDDVAMDCDICCCPVGDNCEPVVMACRHSFCRDCWKNYLTKKIENGQAHHIECPGFQCNKLVPAEFIENIVSREVACRYLQFDIKAFVETNPSIKWCPHPGCMHAVRFPEKSSVSESAESYSRAVACGNAHSFCWDCLGEAHEPASCDHWKEWHQKIMEIKPETLHDTEEQTEMTANCLWLVTNSKSCPHCRSPIQKNEGCNHMKCPKCKHDFCWVCLESWKKHGSSTGGYFRCNRYDVLKKLDEVSMNIKADVQAKNKRMQELNKFVHYYSRFKNHKNSHKLEEPLLMKAREKKFAEADCGSGFVEEAVEQLLRARSVLACSYVYAYYLQNEGTKKIIFEFMQTELEEATELLSEMVARSYLRTPRSKIRAQSCLAHRKRLELVQAITKGLVPPDSPTEMSPRMNFGIDESLREVLFKSIKEIPSGGSRPTWVKDSTGRHANLAAMFDWPRESDESDEETGGTKCVEGQTCWREGCENKCISGPWSNPWSKFCSRQCQKQHILVEQVDKQFDPKDFFADYELQMLRAQEMSRLDFLRRRSSDSVDSNSAALSPNVPPAELESADEDEETAESSPAWPTEEDKELHLAIQLSLADKSSDSNMLPSEYSSIVARVPNKSIEDLPCEAQNPLGAHALPGNSGAGEAGLGSRLAQSGFGALKLDQSTRWTKSEGTSVWVERPALAEAADEASDDGQAEKTVYV